LNLAPTNSVRYERPRRRPRRSPRQRRRARLGLLAAGVVAVLSAWVLLPAVTAPGNDGVAAKVAESARDHGLGFVVTGLEALQSRLSPPSVGGKLDVQGERALAVGACSSTPANSCPT